MNLNGASRLSDLISSFVWSTGRRFFLISCKNLLGGFTGTRSPVLRVRRRSILAGRFVGSRGLVGSRGSSELEGLSTITIAPLCLFIRTSLISKPVATGATLIRIVDERGCFQDN